MDNLMALMRKLNIPNENILIRNEPEYSQHLLLALEQRYGLNTQAVMVKLDVPNDLPVSADDLVTWTETYEMFKSSGGLDSQLNCQG